MIRKKTGIAKSCCHLNCEPLTKNRIKKIGTVGRNRPRAVRTDEIGSNNRGKEELVINLPAPVIEEAPADMLPATK
jgi:hypothetical protein